MWKKGGIMAKHWSDDEQQLMFNEKLYTEKELNKHTFRCTFEKRMLERKRMKLKRASILIRL